MNSHAWIGVLLGLSALATGVDAQSKSLLDARKGFKTKLVRTERDAEALVPPPPNLFSLVKVTTKLGPMGAYLSTAPKPGKRFPAIVWITGGFPSGGIGESAWEATDPANDQSAKAYRYNGLVMMYPTLRGSFGNPGNQETFYGEVDDVLAAIEHLRGVDYVDPKRIYLGGHSTGGTLALLVAAATDQLAGVISFGPVGNPALDYGQDNLTYDGNDAKENSLRSPLDFLGAISAPTWVIEGSEQSNLDSLEELQRANKNPKLHFIPVRSANHFDVLAPTNALIADKLGKLEAGATLELTTREVQTAYVEHKTAQREAADLRTLGSLRARGVSLTKPVTTEHYLLARDRKALATAAKEASSAGFTAGKLEDHEDRSGRPYYFVALTKSQTLGDLPSVFAATKAIKKLCAKHDLQYDGWGVE